MLWMCLLTLWAPKTLNHVLYRLIVSFIYNGNEQRSQVRKTLKKSWDTVLSGLSMEDLVIVTGYKDTSRVLLFVDWMSVINITFPWNRPSSRAMFAFENISKWFRAQPMLWICKYAWNFARHQNGELDNLTPGPKSVLSNLESPDKLC